MALVLTHQTDRDTITKYTKDEIVTALREAGEGDVDPKDYLKSSLVARATDVVEEKKEHVRKELQKAKEEKHQQISEQLIKEREDRLDPLGKALQAIRKVRAESVSRVTEWQSKVTESVQAANYDLQ